ncbi:hypothetical protein D0U04_19780 [Bacillus clarus]|uniref:Variant SH3 domain protein n=1 Tax=Bacillus clarus TaxID=2338372 RepID=A0A090Z054_9BACI|nr:SH3 domain-containing protein [Bacillus clarus]KFN03753.1 variant SH3 domain protein [Bacillus clarus]RFT65107.1 hypothetical protein D0U04_19780 [Bacillus clarus]
MKYIVIQSHESNYPDPICLEKGDVVFIGEKYKGPENWDNWVYCCEEKYNRKGWVPEQIIRRGTGEAGIITEQYTAKELNVNSGEMLQGDRELNGWIWCVKIEGEAGWVPKQSLARYK